MKHIRHPHSGFYGFYAPQSKAIQSIIDFEPDILTLTDDLGIEWNEDAFSKKKYVIGAPQYDQWWLNKLPVVDKRCKRLQYSMSLNKKIAIYMPLFSPQDARWLHPRECIELYNFFCNLSYEISVYIKFHPSTPADSINDFFNKYVPKQNKDYHIVDLPALYLAGMVDAVISVGISTVTMDALVARTPTIEFYVQREHPNFYKCEDGTNGSFAKLHHLALYAQNADELKRWINMIFAGAITWDEYYERLKRYVCLDGFASKRLADIVELCAQGKL